MDWGRKLKLTFNKEVHNLSPIELSEFRLVNAYGESVYPIGINYGDTFSEVVLTFADFNSIVEPAVLECLGCIRMGSKDLPFDIFTFSPWFQNLHAQGDHENISIMVDMVGTFKESMPGMVFESEFININVSMSAEALTCTFENGFERNHT